MVGKQVIVGVIANISNLVAGIAMGWTSTMFPKLSTTGPDNPLDEVLSVETLAWAASLLAIGALVAPVFGGILADKIGRKKTLLFNSLFFVASFLLMGIKPSLPLILVARLFQGFGVGLSMTVQAMYIGEIATDNLRGALSSLMNLCMSFGFLIMNSIGPYLSFITTQRVLIAFPCAFILLLLLFMPESPYYYVAKSRHEEALASLAILRGKPVTDSELAEEIKKIEANISNGGGGNGLKELFTSINLKALSICGILTATQQLSGVNGIFFYATAIFEESGSGLDANVAVIVLCAIQVLAAIFTPFVADKWGRKALLLFSSGTCFLFLTAFAVYKYGTLNEIAAIESLDWLPLSCLVGYLITFSCGLATMPWALTAELFSPQVKSYATPIITCVMWICAFLVTKFFQPVSLAIGAHWMFGIFACFAGLALIFTTFFVFETKGLSLKEVQVRLAKSING